MAERRMFAKTIIDSDAFLDMPLSAQALYFHLSMRADDDGFINNPKRIQRTIGGSDDDYKLLLAKNFVIAFESGVIVIKHWKIHNYIRNDRKKGTAYPEEMKMLSIKENGAYTLSPDGCLSSDGQMSGKCQANVSIGKDSIGKDNIVKDSITPPLPPSWGFDTHTNKENFKYLIESGCEFSEQIQKDLGLFECIQDWMEYKDARKPKSSNHYANEKSMLSLLKKIVTNSGLYGTPAVIGVIEDSMANNYQGIIWDKLTKTPQNKQMTDWSKV